MVQIEDWFQSQVPDSVFSACGGRGLVEAWYTTALYIEEILACAVESDIHLFLLMSWNHLTQLIAVSWIGF